MAVNIRGVFRRAVAFAGGVFTKAMRGLGGRMSDAALHIEGDREIHMAFERLKGFQMGPGKNFAKGCKEAGKFLLQESNRIIPEEYGDLRRSGKVIGDLRTKNPSVGVAYTEYYAAAVHELLEPAPGATRKAKWPGRQGKYLETAFRRNRALLLQIVRDHVRIR